VVALATEIILKILPSSDTLRDANITGALNEAERFHISKFYDALLTQQNGEGELIKQLHKTIRTITCIQKLNIHDHFWGRKTI
jgi:hypothetical protein